METKELKTFEKIEGYIESLECKITCAFCSNTLEVNILEFGPEDLKEGVVDEVGNSGWVEMSSEQFGMIGIACHSCVKTERHWEVDNQARVYHDKINFED